MTKCCGFREITAHPIMFYIFLHKQCLLIVGLFTELFSLIGAPPVQSGTSDSSSNQTKTGVKDPSLPANELLEQGKKSADPKLSLPPGMWPKHTDPLSPHPRQGTHSKNKKGSRDERVPIDHNHEKLRNDGQPNKAATGVGSSNRTQTQKATPEIPVQSNNPPSIESELNHNSRSRIRSQQSSSNTNRESGNARMDPEENRPGKSGLNYSRPFSQYNRRSSSLLYHFDIHKKGERNFLFRSSTMKFLCLTIFGSSCG